MQYGKYYKRISFIANILKTIKRFRVLIISVVSVCLALTSGYLGIQGHVYDEVECPTSLTYGEEFVYEAGAVFEGVDYQFSQDADFASFSTSAPIYPGTYYVRAVSESSFGNPRYGDVHSFTVLPRVLDVRVEQQTVMYGELPSVSADLLNGDKISCSQFAYDDISLEKTNIAAVASSVVITNSAGEDITYAYTINPVKSEITFNKRSITITVEDADQIYNGLPFKHEVYELTAGTLANNGTDILVGTFKDYITDVGEKDNMPTFAVLTKDNIDVSIHYDINVVEGTLTVNKRPVRIDVSDKEFVYDGKEHSNKEFTVNEETPLVDGHKAEINTHTNVVNSGKVKNLLTFKISDSDGNDKTDNYSIFVSEAYITVLKRQISVTSKDGEWVYDGESHGMPEFDITSDTKLAEGDSAEATDNTQITDVNSEKTENMLSLVIKNGDGEDVTSNYEITYTYGELTVTPKPIEIITNDKVFVYNGKAQTDKGYTVSDKTPFVSGHVSSVDTYTTVTNVSEGEVDNIITLTVKDGDKDVTANYDISISNIGKLKVTPLSVTLAPNPETKVYDGTDLYASSIDCSELANGQTATAELVGSQKNVGTSASAIVDGTLVIMDGESTVELENYHITYKGSTLTVTKRYIKIATGSNKWTYDDSYHECREHNLTDNTTLGFNHTTEVKTVETRVKNVSDGPTENRLVIIVKDENGEDVSENYDISYTYGTLAIDCRRIEITSEGKSWVYDDIIHFHKEFDVTSETALVDGHKAEIDTYTEIKYATEGKKDNELTVVIKGKNNEDVSENYIISYKYGELEILKRPVSVSTETDKWIYDGKTHSRSDYTISDTTPLIDGHLSYLIYEETVTEVKEGNKENKVEIAIDDETGYDVTENYDISYSYGTISILPYEITLTTSDGTWVYNGEEHKSMFVIPSRDLITNQYIHYIDSTGVTTVWDSGVDNEVQLKILENETEYDVTSNYDITFVYGTLNITPRPIHLMTDNKTWEYDSLAHSYQHYTFISAFALAYGDTIEVVTYAEITEIGSKANELTVKVMNGDKDYSDNYSIAYSYGQLEITKRNVYVTAGSDTREYDGTPFTCEKYGVENLLSFHILTAETTGEITDVGTADNSIVEGSVKITTADGTDASQYYEIHTYKGTLEIVPRPIDVTAGSATKEYDGTPLTCPDSSITSEKTLVLDHYYVATTTGSITDVGTYPNVVNPESFHVYTENGEDKTHNYIPTFYYGILEVTPRKIVISTGSAEKEYDGTPLTNNDRAVIIEGSLVLDHVLNIFGDGSITDVGTAENGFEGTINDGEGVDKTSNYLVECNPGTLTVTKRMVTVKTDSDSKLYDETPLLSPDGYEITEGSLVDGHKLVMGDKISITDIGFIPNDVSFTVVDSNGQDISFNYKVTTDAGLLEIRPHAIIIITTGSAKKVYDGKPLTNSVCSYEVTEGELLDGHRITSIETTGTITEIGSVPNSYEITIVDETGRDVKKYYAYDTKRLGKLTISSPNEGGGGSMLPDISDDGTIKGGGDSSSGGGEAPVAIEFKSEINGPVYFRYKSFGSYTGNKWLPAPEYDKLLDDIYSYNYLTGIATSKAGIESTPISVKLKGTQYMLPYYVEMKSFNYSIQTSDVIYAGDKMEYEVDYFLNTNISNILDVDLGEYSDEELEYREFVYENYLDIDEETKAYMDKIISENQFSLSDKAVVSKIASYIQNAAKYNLNYNENLDNEENIAIAFLKNYKEGICQHYASSAVLLYRALGIPARYVLGYVGEAEAGNWVEVTVKNAHAWVEVYIDGAGWVYVEVTGGSDNGSGGGSGEEGDEKPGGGGDGGPNLDMSGQINGENVADPNGPSPTVIEIKSDFTAPVYLRLGSFGAYTGNGWLPAVEYDKLLDGIYSYNYLSGIAMKNTGIDAISTSIKIHNSQYFIPYYAAMGEFNYDIQTSDVINKGTNNAFDMEYYFYGGYGLGLEGYLGDYADEELEYREFVYANYLQIDEETKEFMDGIIEKNKFRSDDLRIISKVARFIQGSATYNLGYDKTLDEQKNVVIAFLDTYKQGICQHYASSAVLLYRALGIPARYTLGFTGSTVKGEWSEITASQAHAWVEVYIDGVGWINVEVTGASNGGPSSEGGNEAIKQRLEIRPVDIDKGYDGTPLYAKNELAVDFGSLLELLLNKGYTYEVTVSGSRTEMGSSFSNIESFKIFNQNGNDVTDQFLVICEPGIITITKPQIVIYPYSNQKYYDGKPLEYAPDEYFIMDIPDGLRVEFELSGSITDAGVLDGAELRDLPIKVYDSNNNDVTDDYYIKFDGDFLRIDKRSITIKTQSASKSYDGTPLTCDEIYVVSGSLVEGHTIFAEVTGSIIVEGEAKNTVDMMTFAILDADGVDVTKNYNVELLLGTLTIVP